MEGHGDLFQVQKLDLFQVQKFEIMIMMKSADHHRLQVQDCVSGFHEQV